MKTALGFLTLVALVIAYSAAKSFWSGPLEVMVKQEKKGKVGGSDYYKEMAIITTPIPTPTPTPTTTTITTVIPTCANGCIPPTIGTANAPTAPPPYNTNYNGRNPLISSYPTSQP